MNQLFFALSAFTLGALHALEPGHGKTVVAAYLIGSKGTVRDAVTLGAIVTLTHTSSIIVLGILTAVAAAYFVPETIHELMEVVSGLLIVAVGLYMIKDRIVDARFETPDADQHHHRHGRHHSPGLAAADSPGHRHDHDHDHSPLVQHRGGSAHSYEMNRSQLSLWGLVTLGISGGIVPCPAALAILLAAAAAGNILGGISLVIIFSLGLAAVLVAIGIVLVRAANLAQRYLSEEASNKLSQRAGAISAVVITFMGLVMLAKAFGMFHLF